MLLATSPMRPILVGLFAALATATPIGTDIQQSGLLPNTTADCGPQGFLASSGLCSPASGVGNLTAANGRLPKLDHKMFVNYLSAGVQQIDYDVDDNYHTVPSGFRPEDVYRATAAFDPQTGRYLVGSVTSASETLYQVRAAHMDQGKTWRADRPVPARASASMLSIQFQHLEQAQFKVNEAGAVAQRWCDERGKELRPMVELLHPPPAAMEGHKAQSYYVFMATDNTHMFIGFDDGEVHNFVKI